VGWKSDQSHRLRERIGAALLRVGDQLDFRQQLDPVADQPWHVVTDRGIDLSLDRDRADLERQPAVVDHVGACRLAQLRSSRCISTKAER